MSTGGSLKMEAGIGGKLIGVKAPDTAIDSDVVWTLPATDGSDGQVLATDGSQNLGWVDAGSSTASVNVSSSALENQTEVELVAAPGAGKYVNLIRVAAKVTNPKSANLEIGHSSEVAQVELSLANEYGGINVAGYQKIVGNSNIVAKADTPITSGWSQQTAAGFIPWADIAMSADGEKIAALSEYVYISNDSGVTWAEATTAFSRIAMSADGEKLVALPLGENFIHTSSDGGINWSTLPTSPFGYWDRLAMSADGEKIAAVFGSHDLFFSTDSGVTWATISSEDTFLIAISGDGTKLAKFNILDGLIYTSTDNGLNWIPYDLSPSGWSSIAMSYDGEKLAAITVGDGFIYTSTNGGINWSTQTASGSHEWSDIAMSNDGEKIVAATYVNMTRGQSLVSLSTDCGVTWTEQEGLDATYNWESIAMSSTGDKMAAAAYAHYVVGEGNLDNAYIYTYDASVTSVDLVVDYTIKDLPA